MTLSGSGETPGTPQIFVWQDAPVPRIGSQGLAIAEDGTVLTGHFSTNRGFFALDMGLMKDHDWSKKHDIYRAHYRDGYELVEVPEGQEATHPGLLAALSLLSNRTSPKISSASKEVEVSAPPTGASPNER